MAAGFPSNFIKSAYSLSSILGSSIEACSV